MKSGTDIHGVQILRLAPQAGQNLIQGNISTCTRWIGHTSGVAVGMAVGMACVSVGWSPIWSRPKYGLI